MPPACKLSRRGRAAASGCKALALMPGRPKTPCYAHRGTRVHTEVLRDLPHHLRSQPASARAALSFVAFDSYKSANPTNGSFVLARARDGETQARGDFFAAHWRPATAADVAVVRGDDAPGEEPLELVVTDARGRSASTS